MSQMISRTGIIICVLMLTGCSESGIDAYNSLLEKERAGNKRINDIFMGISLGMTNKDFYMHCWDMNKKGLFFDGSGNTAVKYKLKNKELKHDAEMNFYPEFTHGKIAGMWVKFQYEGWVPWNKKLDSDDLLEDVLQLYRKWYAEGNPFITINDKERGTIYIKVDGNRRIIIGRFDEVQVKVDYTDLSALQK
jgi:hypothetical protein